MSTGKAESKRAEQKSAEDRALATSSAATAAKPNFFQERAEDDFKKFSAWKDAKDYRTPAPGMISLGFGDPAQRQRMRERTFNLADTGAVALGGAGNATALQMAKLNVADEFDRDQANAYEGAIKNEDAYQRGQAQAWSGQANQQTMGIASLYNSRAANSAQLAAQLRPQSLLPGLISAGASIGAGFATGGLSSMVAKKPKSITASG